MKKSSLLLGFGAAASLLVTPMIAGGCKTTHGAKGMSSEKSCGCKGDGQCDGECEHKCEGKCGDKMKNEGSCGEGSCGSNK